MTETITARLPDELVQRVDAAVKRGIFPSRSEALREIIEDHLREHPELFLDIKLEELLGRELSDEELSLPNESSEPSSSEASTLPSWSRKAGASEEALP